MDAAPDLAALRLFVQVAEAGSLSRAAVGLETTQPAISRRVAAIERAWGGRLFHRTGRGVILTELGEQVLPRAQGILAEAGRLAEEIAGARGLVRGVVRIASLPSVALLVIPPILRQLREAGLDIRIEVLEGENTQIEQWLSNGRSDLSILYRYGRPPPNETALMTVDSCLVGRAGDPLLDGPSVPFARLDGLPLVLAPRPNLTRHVLDQIARRHRIALRLSLEAASLALQKRVVELGECYAILPRFTVAEEVESGRLAAIPLVAPRLLRVVAAGHGSGSPLSPAAREVLRLIRLFARTDLRHAV